MLKFVLILKLTCSISTEGDNVNFQLCALCVQ